MTDLRPGDAAPDFSLDSHQDARVSPRDFRGRSVVLAFFPLAWTPV